MKLYFEYNKEKDIEAILSGGPSLNDASSTNIFLELQSARKDITDEITVQKFHKKALLEKKVNDIFIQSKIDLFKSNTNLTLEIYTKIAEHFFETKLDIEIIVYLTISPRCPYSIDEKYFFINVFSKEPMRIVMHEIWHFYTWEACGQEEMERIGFEKYNEAKESLTVLLNVLCADLLEEGVTDKGYENHRNMRERILELHAEGKDFKTIWEKITSK